MLPFPTLRKEGGANMRKEVPTVVVVIVLLIVIAAIAFLFYRGTRTPPPQVVNPITGEPIQRGTEKALIEVAPEHAK